MWGLLVGGILLWAGLAQTTALSIAREWKSTRSQSRESVVLGDTLPDPDGHLHLYALPIGQGDTNIIQCPDGTLNVYDLGSKNKNKVGFWRHQEVNAFFNGRFGDIRNIILTHNHFDHVSLIGEVLRKGRDLSGVENIYISCTPEFLPVQVTRWLDTHDLWEKVRTINEGYACGMNGVSCGTISLCPNYPSIRTKILAANYGQQCNVTRGNANIDSIVLKIAFGEVSMMLNGDFEDFYPTLNEKGPSRAMVNFYGSELEVTLLQISHHGGFFKANKPILLEALKPKVMMASGNFEYRYNHPTCGSIDYLLNKVPKQTVCKPLAGKEDPLYCGSPLYSNIPPENQLQKVYTCGEDDEDIEYRSVENNEYAFYTTTPDEDSLNLLTFSTDGIRWSFTTYNLPRPKKLNILGRK